MTESRKREHSDLAAPRETKKYIRDFGVFDETTSDGVLVASGRKFHVSKHHLASHSDFFKSMFFKEFDESTKDEIVLENVEAEELQKFLETINGELCIDVLRLSDMWCATTPMNACERFLMRDSKKSRKDIFSIARGYNLQKLKDDLISKANNHAELQSILPNDVMSLDHATMGAILKKFSALTTSHSRNQHAADAPAALNAQQN
ncbi:hypothetical protein GCK72_007573 [Caenorhabditis remanei]|uniref:BTB domain-containing protein n=1 Tax=Caenorhabditis remanei TaxID=31234 RepID=A0A6A5HLX4_CAERE|nr:hypothetical protein GCK72_007573 [Caenorhabditis remanei]KAF1767614.1 hypothetical protein GCK72_007573 [Caenorhabditis remanei]